MSVDKLQATSKSHRVCNCFNLSPFICGDFRHSQKINVKYCLQHNILTSLGDLLCRSLQSSMSPNRWLIPSKYPIILGLIVHVEKCISLRLSNFHSISDEHCRLKSEISSLPPVKITNYADLAWLRYVPSELCSASFFSDKRKAQGLYLSECASLINFIKYIIPHISHLFYSLHFSRYSNYPE